jgi:hypothetical protein
MRWSECGGTRWLEAELPGARVAFSTRVGGVSEEPWASLNLGLLSGDDRQAVLDNRRRLAAALGLDAGRVAIARQVHGTVVREHDGPPDPVAFPEPAGELPEADGHLTRAAGIPLAILAADCLPIALRGPAGLALLHCGWRGLAGGILARGATAVEATHAAIGPAIGPCCYEVGEEVLAAFSALGRDVASGRRLDLSEVAERQLSAAGVARVERAALCTSCERDLFFSHRRDGRRTGRQAAIAWIEEDRPCPG